MACDCQTEINELKCRLDSAEKNIDALWNETFSDGSIKTMYFAADFGDATVNSVLNLSNFLNEVQGTSTEEFLGFIGGGDLNYPSGSSGTIDLNLAPFQALITTEKFFPALGNHDLDATGIGSVLTSKFTYLPINGPSVSSDRRCYYLDLRDSCDAVFYILDTGYNTAGTFVSPDSIATQRDWLYSSMLNLQASKNIVVCHHPFISFDTVPATRYKPLWDLEFAQNNVDMVLNGHAHIDSHVERYKLTPTIAFKTDIINCSSFMNFHTKTVTETNPPIAPIADFPIFISQSQPHVVKIAFFKNRIMVSFIKIDTTPGQTTFLTEHSFVR